LTQESEIDKLFEKVGNYRYTVFNTPKERRAHLHGGGSLKSRESVESFNAFFVQKNRNNACGGDYTRNLLRMFKVEIFWTDFYEIFY
jgi:hypothetical protein